MAQKQVELAGLGSVTLVKRRGARHIRLSVQPDGKVRVSMPVWVPYQAGLEFAKQKSEWIAKHRGDETRVIEPGQRVGKAHRVQFVPRLGSQKVTTRLQAQTVQVFMPTTVQSTDLSAQQAAHQASLKALRQEAEQLLPTRLRTLAAQYGYTFESVTVRQLKTRWGSCTHKRDITLNYYLMQLPWHLIDYVLLHELTHTKHLNHSSAFWAEMERRVPNVKQLRKELKNYRPWLLTY